MPMHIDVNAICQLHQDTVESWHHQEVDNPYDGLLSVVCQQHQFNFLLWHEEDIARSPDVGDKKIAAVKRAIDGYNQKRNDWIEKIDDWITGQLMELRIAPATDAKQNTETPGSAMDRLSIMSLRIYHMLEQLERTDASDSHLDSVRQKLARCYEQKTDLANSLTELLGDIYAGRKQHKTYRQFKMYNDPNLNPYLYQPSDRRAA